LEPGREIIKTLSLLTKLIALDKGSFPILMAPTCVPSRHNYGALPKSNNHQWCMLEPIWNSQETAGEIFTGDLGNY
jgi:hypothetical protein